ncbi:hypothetical protein ANANG_G00173870 [Anguilla anguilla]|uniref:Uncharacterized protein n=1 Tax=Anguilla anguilla TaxID=7936 RepID=A0A9D3M797_ANGAN|nr:hypothetical protein ANANG_G00173870 [Anguilla anguilla]
MAVGETDSDPGEVELSEEQTPPATDEPVDSQRQGDTRCGELWYDIPLCVPLPIEILSAETTFPFLEATLANLGIEPTQVQERVLWADSRRTTVQSSSGKIKEKAIMLLEVRVKAQRPDNPDLREVLYATETHSDRSFGRCSLDVLPWINIPDSQPVEVTLSLDIEIQPEIEMPEEQQEVEE